jgi:pyrophosphate--fructose-6-phosphate 1-phosphotransferase
VIAGVYDFIKKQSAESVLIGFLDGPQGIYNGKFCIIDDKMMNSYRNMGGFDMIGSGRHKIEKPAEFAASLKNCQELELDGLIIIGGDDSNTNAALLAEYFEANHCRTKVCGAPKTIDGDLKVDPYIPISFGFDTACRTYSELIGNLGQDTMSTQKYYHFVRLMGRAASNITLECALQTRPNIGLISEEVEANKKTLAQITQEVVDVIVQRSAQGKDYGIVLLPEGLIEFIPEFNHLIAEINDVLAAGTPTTEEAVMPELSFNNRAVFSYLPANIKQQLLLDRDPHGNVQVAKIETEKLLAQTVASELELLHKHGKYSGKFTPQFHSYGYEGRSGLPSQFDATYCYVLGQNVAALISLGLNGLISSVTNLSAPVADWVCGGVPITMMCHMEKRHGHMKPVIKKALVELEGEPFRAFASQRSDWAKYDLYRSPGPMQFPLHSAQDHELDGERLDMSVTLTLELLKYDARMDPVFVEEAKRIQDAAVVYSSSSGLRFAPLRDGGSNIHSSLQRKRALNPSPELCPAFRGCNRGSGGAVDVASVIRKQATHCNVSSDRAAISSIFPLTYGARLISIVSAEEAKSNADAVSGVSPARKIGVW